MLTLMTLAGPSYYYCITTDELLNPETDERLTVLYVCMIPCDTR